MASWLEVTQQAPALAALVRARFEAHGLGLMATLRKDGAPRISGIEPLFTDADLWLGMMPGSRKVADLVRDGRFSLHNATVDKNVTEGDVRVSGRAVLVEDAAALEQFRAAFRERTGQTPPEGPISLFRAEITEVSTLRPAGDHLDIGWWRENGGTHQVDRY